jgi:hypothetical protein
MSEITLKIGHLQGEPNFWCKDTSLVMSYEFRVMSFRGSYCFFVTALGLSYELCCEAIPTKLYYHLLKFGGIDYINCIKPSA